MEKTKIMPTKLTFPKLSYVKLGLWSIRQKIQFATGYTPHIWSNSQNLFVEFTQDLTTQEEDDVSAIVNHADAQGPNVDLMVVNNSYILRDPWEWRDQIATDTGIDFSLWYRSSGLVGAGIIDEIVIIPTDSTHTAQRILTNPQKNALVEALTDGNRWE
jgi:hypothetical protein